MSGQGLGGCIHQSQGLCSQELSHDGSQVRKEKNDIGKFPLHLSRYSAFT